MSAADAEPPLPRMRADRQDHRRAAVGRILRARVELPRNPRRSRQADPIRRTAAAQSPAPVKRVVWLFGGSTVFGYNVPDDQTLAAHLQNELQRRYPGTVVINHGHLGHDSSQELALLEWLLRSGQHADAAIFIDGLNDARHEVDPPLDDYDSKKWVTIDPMFPPVRVLRAVLRRFGKDDRPQPVWPPPADDVAGRARAAATRYLVNVRGSRAIATASGIPSLFILQPTSYDRRAGQRRGRGAGARRLELESGDEAVQRNRARRGKGDRRPHGRVRDADVRKYVRRSVALRR